MKKSVLKMDNQEQEQRSSLNIPQRRRTRAAGLTAFREESREDRDEADDMDDVSIAIQRPSEMTFGIESRGKESILSDLPNLGKYYLIHLMVNFTGISPRYKKIPYCRTCRRPPADNAATKS